MCFIKGKIFYLEDRKESFKLRNGHLIKLVLETMPEKDRWEINARCHYF